MLAMPTCPKCGRSVEEARGTNCYCGEKIPWKIILHASDVKRTQREEAKRQENKAREETRKRERSQRNKVLAAFAVGSMTGQAHQQRQSQQQTLTQPQPNILLQAEPQPTVPVKMRCEVCDKYFMREIELLPGEAIPGDGLFCSNASCNDCSLLVMGANKEGEDVCPKCGENAIYEMSDCRACGERLPWANAMDRIRRMELEYAASLQQKPAQNPTTPEPQHTTQLIICQSCLQRNPPRINNCLFCGQPLPGL